MYLNEQCHSTFRKMANAYRLLPLTETRTVIPVVEIPAAVSETIWPTKISVLRAKESCAFQGYRFFQPYFTVSGKLAKDFIHLSRLFRRSVSLGHPPAACNGQSGRLYWYFRNNELAFKPVYMQNNSFVILQFKEVQELMVALSIYPYPALKPTDPYYGIDEDAAIILRNSPEFYTGQTDTSETADIPALPPFTASDFFRD